MAKKGKSKKKSGVRKQSPPASSSPVQQFLGKHPHLLPLSILLILLLLFFQDVMFGNKTFQSPDRLSAQSVVPFSEDARERGIYPLWNPYIFSGMPSFASLQRAPHVDILGSINHGISTVFQAILPVSDFTRALIEYFLLGFFMYLLLIRKTGMAMVALFAALAMVFQPQVISFIAFGHSTKLTTLVFVPIIFLLLDELLNSRKLHYFALFALAIGLQLLRNHTQMAYYTWMMIGLFTLYWIVDSALKKRPLREIIHSFGLVVAGLLLGVAVSSWMYLSVLEYADYSIRGGGTGLDYIYATNWSFAPSEIITFFIPSFVGFGGETYWGGMPFTDYPMYMGVVTIMLAGLAIVIRNDKHVIFLSLLAVLALLVAFGKHLPILYGPLFEFLPFFNKFRVPSMINILVAFALVVLAGFGLNGLRDVSGEQMQKKVRIYTYVFLGVCGALALFLLLAKGAYLSLVGSSAKPLSQTAREAAYTSAAGDGVKLLILVGLTALLITSYLKGKLKWQLLGAAMVALVVVDLWFVDFKIAKPRPKADASAFFAENHVVRFLKKDSEPFRIYPVFDNKPVNWYMYHLIQNVLGYHAAKLKIYQTFLEQTQMDSRNLYGMAPFLDKYLNVSHSNGRPAVQMVTPDGIPQPTLKADYALLDMLNIKYLISNFQIPDPRFKLVVQGQPSVYENTQNLPRAYFVDRVRVLKGEAFFTHLKSGNFDPHTEAVLENELATTISPASEMPVEITSYDIHEIVLEAEVLDSALLVLSDVYYPAGWKAYVGDVETEILPTNYIMRSIVVPPGKHTIRFVFEPARFTIGLWITVGTLVTLILLTLLGWWAQRNKSGAPRAAVA